MGPFDSGNAFVIPKSSSIVPSLWREQSVTTSSRINPHSSSSKTQIYSFWSIGNIEDDNEDDDINRSGSLNYKDVKKRKQYDEETLLQCTGTSTPYKEQLGYIEERIEAVQWDRQQQAAARRVTAGVALAAGTAALAFNGDVTAAAVDAMVDKVQSVSPVARDVLKPLSPSFRYNINLNEPAVTLHYLEEQIRQAEAALRERSMMGGSTTLTMADGTAPAPSTTTATPPPSAPSEATVKPAAPKEVVVSSSETSATPKPTAAAATTATTSSETRTAPKPETPTATTTAATTAQTTTTSAAPKPVESTAQPAATTTTTTTATPSKPAASATATAPQQPTKPAAVAAASPAKKVAEKNAPSLYRYTAEHIPQWEKAWQKNYATAKPAVVKAVGQFEKDVIPKVVKVEHELLGDEFAGGIDKVASATYNLGKIAYGLVERTVPIIYEGGKQVIKAVPQIYEAGKNFYTTVDKKVIPEIKKDVMIVKDVVEKKTPEVIKAGKLVYTTGKQLAHSIEEDVLPKVMEAEKKLAPKFYRLEHELLGDELANSIDKTADLTFKTARNVVKVVDKNAPKVLYATQKTAQGVVSVGRVAYETGKQVYRVADKTVPEMITATRIIATELDRAGGQLAYSIDESVPVITKAISKELPKIVETGRQVQKTVDPAVVQLAASGRAISSDIANLMANPSNFGIQLTPDEKETLGTFTAVGVATTVAASAFNSRDTTYSDSFGQFSSRRRFR
jgi:hypothetical protein